MKKLLTLTLLIIGSISTINTGQNINENENTNEDVELYQAGLVAGYEASNNRPFSLNVNQFAYRDGNTGELYVAGSAVSGQLGVAADAPIQYSFPVYKNGIAANTFIDPLNFSFNANAIILDADGKVYTAGANSIGQTGNGVSGNYNTVTSFGLRNVGGSSSYNAVAVATGGSTTMVLLENGALYGTGYGDRMGLSASTSTFSRIDGATTLPLASEKDGIVNFGGVDLCSYVLFGDGDLYRCYVSTSWVKVASNVKLVNFAETGGMCAVFLTNDNEVYLDYRTYTEPTLLTKQPIEEDVKQLLATDAAWGYLTTENDLYITTKAEGEVPTASNYSRASGYFYKFEEKILYAEISGSSSSTLSYAILTEEGQIKLWGSSDNYKFGNGSNSIYPYEWAVTPENGWFDSSTYPGVTTPPKDDDTTTETPGVTPDTVPTDFSDVYPILRSHTANNHNGTNINSHIGIQLTYGTYLKLDYSNHQLDTGERIDVNITSIDGTYSKDWTWSTTNDDLINNYPVTPNYYIITSKVIDVLGAQVGGSNVVTYEILSEKLSLSVSSQLRSVLQGDEIKATEGCLYEASYNKIMNGLLDGLYVTANTTIYSNNENNIFSTTAFDNIGALTTENNWSIYFTDATVTSFNKSLAVTTLERNTEYKVWIMLDGIYNYETTDVLTTSFKVLENSTSTGTPESTPDTSPESTPDEDLSTDSVVTYVMSGIALVSILWAVVATLSKRRS